MPYAGTNEAPRSERLAQDDPDRQLLRVASTFEELQSSEQTRKRGRLVPGTASSAAERILTAADRSLFGDL